MAWKKGDLGRMKDLSKVPQFEVLSMSADQKTVSIWPFGSKEPKNVLLKDFKDQALNWWVPVMKVPTTNLPSWLVSGRRVQFEVPWENEDGKRAWTSPDERSWQDKWRARDGSYVKVTRWASRILVIRTIHQEMVSVLDETDDTLQPLLLVHLLKYGTPITTIWDAIIEDE